MILFICNSRPPPPPPPPPRLKNALPRGIYYNKYGKLEIHTVCEFATQKSPLNFTLNFLKLHTKCSTSMTICVIYLVCLNILVNVANILLNSL